MPTDREPHIPSLTPITLELQPGTYQWCACGHSEGQPFCDMSCDERVGPGPVTFEIRRTTRVEVCLCKHTASRPYCDNSHKSGEVRRKFLDGRSAP